MGRVYSKENVGDEMQFKNWGESYRAIRMWGNVGDDLKLICAEKLLREGLGGGLLDFAIR